MIFFVLHRAYVGKGLHVDIVPFLAMIFFMVVIVFLLVLSAASRLSALLAALSESGKWGVQVKPSIPGRGRFTSGFIHVRVRKMLKWTLMPFVSSSMEQVYD